MNPPPFEVADIIRAHGKNFIDRNRSWLKGGHLKVLSAIERCRTAALGGHRDRCLTCGYAATSYSFNSCRNRHCPKCQTNARDKWLARRNADLMPVAYVHVVFTLPHLLAPLAYRERDTKHNRSRAARHAKPHGAAESTRKAGPVTGQNAQVELHDATPALSRRVAMERPVRRAR